MPEKSVEQPVVQPVADSQRKGKKPALFMLMLGIMVIEAVVLTGVMQITSGKKTQTQPEGTILDEKFYEIDLGEFSRVFQGPNLYYQFVVEVRLELNPVLSTLSDIKKKIEQRTTNIRHVINEVIYDKTYAAISSPQLIKTLGEDIKKKVNEQFPISSGEKLVQNVYFHKFIQPQPLQKE